MHDNTHGVWLDADGRPQPLRLAGRRRPARVRRLPCRAVAAVRGWPNLVLIPATTVMGVVAMALRPDAQWLSWVIAVFGLQAVVQLAAWVYALSTALGPARRRRRYNLLRRPVAIAANVALLAVVVGQGVAWLVTPGPAPDPWLVQFGVPAFALGLLWDIRALRRAAAWQRPDCGICGGEGGTWESSATGQRGHWQWCPNGRHRRTDPGE